MNYQLKAKSYPPKIGIVGGGQLGKMLVIAAKKLGFYVIVLDPTHESPAGQVADKQILADYKDRLAILRLADAVDFVTFEIELANDHVLKEIALKGKSVNPSPKTLTIMRDKLLQKQFLTKHGIATAPFFSIEVKKTVPLLAKKVHYPFLLKARTNAYDGRGNFLIQNEDDIEKGLRKLANSKLYIEKFIPFVKELAIMVSRDMKGNIAVYPVVETHHKNNILDYLVCPAQISKHATKKATLLAKKVMEHLNGAGVFGIEMFLKKDDTVLVNEIAPRVHNSGHYTIEASVTSQFEQHIRAITGLPLGSTKIIPKAVVMKNILASKNGSGYPKGIKKALSIENVSLHLYNKHESRPERKMGHITVVGETVEECLKKAKEARRVMTI